MKKILLSAVMLLAAVTSAFADKTVTLDLTKPANFGYAVPEAGGATPLEVGQKVTQDEVTITVATNGDAPVRFWSTDGAITFRLASGCSVDIEAGGANIKKIELTGKNIKATNIDATPGTFTDALWEGSAPKVTFTRKASTVQIATMTVTYEAAETGGGSVESYKACSTEITDWKAEVNEEGKTVYSCTPVTTAADVFTNATIADGKSIVNFSTTNMDVVAVGGANPVDVKGEPGGTFPGWQAWQEVKWEVKNQNLDDKKTEYFDYILGTGNPYVALEAEEVTTDGVGTGMWRGLYTFYEADGSNGMPINGLYYKFSPKADGTVKVRVFSNKGNRNTYVVDEATKTPIAYKAEGYINGQNETLDDGTSRKKYLSAEEIQEIHNSMKVVDGVDTAPYVIAGGNQNFWGYLTFNVKAGGCYWLFQHSSQIGFGGYEFTTGGSTGIEEIPAAIIQKNDNRIYNISGQQVNGSYRGIVIKNGKKYVK